MSQVDRNTNPPTRTAKTTARTMTADFITSFPPSHSYLIEHGRSPRHPPLDQKSRPPRADLAAVPGFMVPSIHGTIMAEYLALAVVSTAVRI
jgi:hypothetical protein